MKTITNYITEKQHFLIKKHVNKHTIKAIEDIEEGDFFFENHAPGGGYSGGKYLSYCVKEVYGVLYVCSLGLDNSDPVQPVALDLYNPDTDDYKEVTFSSEIPNKYTDIYEKYVEFINGIDFDKIAQRQYDHKLTIGTYSNSKETFTTSIK